MSQQIDWYRVPLSKEQLKEFNTLSDAKGLFQAGGHLAMTLTLFGLTVYSWSHWPWYSTLLCFYFYGEVCGNMNAGVHELIHERVFKTQKLNTFFVKILSYFTYWNYPYFNVSHKEHHRYTLNPPMDLEVVQAPGGSLFPWKTGFIDLPYFFRAMKRNYYLAKGGALPNPGDGGLYSKVWSEYLFDKIDESEKNQIRSFAREFFLVHAIVWVLGLASGYWIVPVLFTFGNIVGNFIGHYTGALQHLGLVDKVNDFRLNCRTYTCNRLFMFLYWNMNYHIEHHMYAAVPCYNLPKLHKAIEKELPPIHRSLLSAWSEIAFILFRQKADPTYQYVQNLPEWEGKQSGIEKYYSNQQQDKYAKFSEEELTQFKIWECLVCGFVYDEALGMPEEGIAAGTKWDDIPEDWECPDCGVAKSDFHMVERSRVVARGEQLEEQLNEDPIVIIGSGIAGYNLAKEYRKHNKSQELVLLSRDKAENYSKPQLSTALNQGKKANEIVSKNASQMAEELDITIHNCVEVDSINRSEKMVSYGSKELKYSQLVLALGADQIELQFTGSQYMHRINDLNDYRNFRQELNGKKRVLILGSGLIGCELANDLLDTGHKVEMVDLADHALSQLIPHEVASALQTKLIDKGAVWNMQSSLKAIVKKDDTYLCELSNNSSIEVDLVISAIGLRARTQLASNAGIICEKGIVVDQFMRTNDAHIYALGDCAQIEGMIKPFIQAHRICGQALAKTLAGYDKEVYLPQIPVLIKTPSMPLISLPPKRELDGEWKLISKDNGYKYYFLDKEATIQGFVLSDEFIKDKEEIILKLGQKVS